jgi:peptidoglycan/LPS O-acetylase OafA/YrhL
MGEQARELSGPPHHIQRLTTMAAMAIAVGLVSVLAAFQTRGWRICAWCVGAAALVFGLASLVFPSYRGSPGGGWGALAVGSGLLYILVAEVRAKRDSSRRGPG